jgi:hypothetical protein
MDTPSIVEMPLASLVEDPHNARQHPDGNIAAIRASLLRFGQVEPLVVHGETGIVASGNGRLRVMRELGWPSARVIVYSGSAAEARALGVAINQSATLAAWDDSKLFQILESLKGTDLFPALGFDGRALAAAIEGAASIDISDELKALAGGPAAGTPIGVVPRVFSEEQIIEAAFCHYREAGFPYPALPLYEQMEQVNKIARAIENDSTSPVGTHVADTYHRHRFSCRAGRQRTMTESFTNDVSLRKAIRLAVSNGMSAAGMLSHSLRIVNGTQACTNFRPVIAGVLYRRFAEHGGIVVDPCAGFGGRLLGWFASRIGGRYIGTDPSTPTHEANVRMIAALGIVGAEVHRLPFEDAPVELFGGAGTASFIFTSPPYFTKEHYSGDPEQSCNRYATIGDWERGFLRVLLEKSAELAKPGAHIAINIDDVKIGTVEYPLQEMTKACAAHAGLELVGTEVLKLTSITNSEEYDASEPIFIFRKPVRGS